MPTTAITFNDQDLSAAALQYFGEPSVMRERTYRGWDHYMAAKKTLSGGEYLIPRWIVNEHSQPSGLSTGYEAPDLTVQTVYQPGVQRPIFVVQPIMISLRDRTVYSGKSQLLNILGDRTRTVRDAMNRNGQSTLFRGPAASGSWAGVAAYTSLIGLNGTDNTTGFFEAAASGTNTIHGVSKATYPATTHPQFHNVYATAGDTAGTTLLNAMYGILVELGIRGSPPSASESKWYASANGANYLKRVLRPLESYVGEKQLDDAQRMAMTYGGLGLFPHQDMPTNGATTATTEYSVMLVNWKQSVCGHLYSKWQNELTCPFITIPGTVEVQVGLMGFAGNNLADKMGFSALVANAETF